MPEWVIGMIGLLLGALLISILSAIQSYLNSRAMRSLPSPVRVTYDNSPKATLARTYGCDKERISVRPIIPEDVDKTDWVWRDNEMIKTTLPYRLLELTGIDCGKWAAVSVYNNEIGSIRIGVLTSWDNTASVIVNPLTPVYLRQMVVGGETSEHFALRGKVYEPEGAYIV